jgi:hypothetical protein
MAFLRDVRPSDVRPSHRCFKRKLRVRPAGRLAGRGFKVHREDMKKLLLATRARSSTCRTSSISSAARGDEFRTV